MSRGHFIGLNHHRLMLADRLRMEAYREAIERRVEPGMRVMDLGTGTGILAMWAARLGADVLAVEPHAVVHVARRIASDNGLAERIRFVQADSQAMTLADDEKVDLVVTECMGNFFVTDEMMPVLRDLPRHMRPGGRTMPERIALFIGAATLPMWRELAFWEDEIGGFDYSGALDFAAQAAYVVHCEPELMMTAASKVADFPLVEAPDTLSLSVELVADKSATVHGLIGWFDADLGEGVTLSTAPGQRTHWGQMVFPLPPVPMRPGDRIAATVTLAMDEALRSYFRWTGVIRTAAHGDEPFDCDTRKRFGADGDGEPAR